MKKLYKMGLLALFATFFLQNSSVAQGDLVISGIADGPLTGGTPKALEIYVINDVADLSAYSLSKAANGNAEFDAASFVFPAVSATAGDYIYFAHEDVGFPEFFGFPNDYTHGFINVNGDDVVGLFHNDVLVDVFGELGVDGTGLAWEHLDGWAYRVDGTGPSATFDENEWIFSGINVFDDQTTNATSPTPFPLGTYVMEEVEDDGIVDIIEIQNTSLPNGDSPLIDSVLTTTGIVTAQYEDGFFIQDGVGEWTGIFVSNSEHTVIEGDSVLVSGLVDETNGYTKLIDVTDVTVVSQGHDLPAATNLSTVNVSAEEYESVLVSISNAINSTEANQFGEWYANDGSGEAMIDDAIYDAEPVLNSVYNITGVVEYSFSNFKILPRYEADVELVSSGVLTISVDNPTISVVESAGTVTVTFEITNPAETATTFDVVVTGGTAVEGTDFDFTDPTTITFEASATEAQSFTFDITDDEFANEDKTIIFGFENITNDAFFTSQTINVTIQDDDTELEITPIGDINVVDENGVAVFDGQEFNITGIVYGVNLNNGAQFTIIDETGGIGVFSGPAVSGYVVTEGDSVVITGVVNQFNGLTQVTPSQITLVSQDHDLVDPLVVTELNESTESQLVTLECVYIVDMNEWTAGAGSGFSVTISNGTDEFDLRIDNNVDLFNAEAPVGTFNVTGIGSQFDFDSPYDTGYQILPRYSADIETAECEMELPPVNDDCSNAISLQDLIGGEVDVMMTSALATNVNATVGDADPANGFDCFAEPDGTASEPSLENTVWFSFTGDGETYFIETTNCGGTATDYIDDGDSQMAIYSGICGFYTPEACSEDGDQDAPEGEFPAGIQIETLPGTEYFIMVDGYNGTDGEFCVSFTKLNTESIYENPGFEFELFPNPSNGNITISSTNLIEGVKVYNMLGKEVYSNTANAANKIQLDIQDVDAGVYFVSVFANGKRSVEKIVIE